MAGALTCFVEDKIQILLLPLKFSIALAKSWNPPMPQDYLANIARLLKAQTGYPRGDAWLDLSEKAHDVAASCTILQNYGAELLSHLHECLRFNIVCATVKQLQTIAYLHLPSWRQRRFRSRCQHGRAATTCSQLRCLATEAQLWLCSCNPLPGAITANSGPEQWRHVLSCPCPPLRPCNLISPHLSLFCKSH